MYKVLKLNDFIICAIFENSTDYFYIEKDSNYIKKYNS